MHLLSTRNRYEFLATPELIRLVLADGKDGPEATLLVKTTTLSLKYLIRTKRLRLSLFRLHRWLGYGIQIDEDSDHPATLWSVLSYPDEFAAAMALASNPTCVVFLFNELALNVAWGSTKFDLSSTPAIRLLNTIELDPSADAQLLRADVDVALRSLASGELSVEQGILLPWSDVSEWHPVVSHYITNRLGRATVSIFEADEGGQQEQLAHWLVDNLHPAGAIRSPQVHEKAKVRELSDVLLSYEHGVVLIESKTLAVWVRETLPPRQKLAADVAKHLRKAVRQLAGSVKNMRRGLRITDLQGREADVERNGVPHIIVLVPDLNLLWNATEFDGSFFLDASKQCGGMFHILDLSELLRIVQAAETISSMGRTTSRMMAFDYYLIERAKLSFRQQTPNFKVLLRVDGANDAPPDVGSTDV